MPNRKSAMTSKPLYAASIPANGGNELEIETMLILNGKKFAANDDEFCETLFQHGGTAVGYYKPRKRHIDLFNMQWVHIGTINAHGVLCAATPLPNGRTWYNFATIKEIGRYESYTQSVEEPRAALKEHCASIAA